MPDPIDDVNEAIKVTEREVKSAKTAVDDARKDLKKTLKHERSAEYISFGANIEGEAPSKVAERKVQNLQNVLDAATKLLEAQKQLKTQLKAETKFGASDAVYLLEGGPAPSTVAAKSVKDAKMALERAKSEMSGAEPVGRKHIAQKWERTQPTNKDEKRKDDTRKLR